MHVKRWITGLVALPFLVYPIYAGGTPFAVFVAVASIVALWEYYKIVFAASDGGIDGTGRRPAVIPVIGLITAPAMVWTAHRFSMELVVCLIIVHLIVCAFFSFLRFKTDRQVTRTVVTGGQALIYIPLTLAFAVLIRDGADGMRWLFFVLAIVFAGDIGALYAGTYLGRHKLCPAVSPGKTIEGSLGGLAGNVVVGALVKLIFFPRLPWKESLVFFLALGIAGQIGDLYESQFKRAAGVKDSGVILPGHGGLLDRIDALLFALPVAYFFKKFILWV